MATVTDATFDVLVLGAGSGGYACALRAAQLGLRVGLIEKDRLGGTCLHSGCIPTKALLHAGEVADSARDAGRFGVLTTLDGIDMSAVNAYKDGVVTKLFTGLSGLVRSRGVTLIEGTGELVGTRAVRVGETTYSADHLVLATGSTIATLPGLDADGERIITSDHALGLDRVPESVVVLGGGVIGCEFASIWASFGAEVTILEALPRLLPGEDETSSKALERAFKKRGIRLLTGERFREVKQTDAGVTVRTESDRSVEGELMLVAVGRRPASEGLPLAEHGIEVDGAHVAVDERLRTSAAGVYAVGDLVAGPQLAHRGFAHGIFVAEEIAGLAPRPVEDHTIPKVTYSHPEVASVGLTETAAREEYGDDVETLTYDLGGNGKSQILQTQGFVKLIRRAGGPVLGIHLVGDRVGELVGEAQLIHGWEAEPADVAPLVHAHPTQNEAMGEAFLALAGKPLHTHS